MAKLAKLSHPAQLQPAETRQTVLLAVNNMHCSRCVASIEHALQAFSQPVHISADTTSRTLSITWNEQQQPLQPILNAIERAGFDAQLVNLTADQSGPSSNWQRIGVAFLFGMQTMMLALSDYLGAAEHDPLITQVMNMAQWVSATIVVFYSGWPFIYGALRDLQQRQVTMDLPVGLAISAAYSFSAINVMRGHGELWFDSAVMFITLLLWGRQLESQAKNQASATLTQLFKQQKNHARLLFPDGSTQAVRASQIKMGDLVQVLPSETLPVDGVALNASVLSEAVLTGESLPQSKAKGDKVYAGSVHVGDSILTIKTTASGQQTSLGRISQLMHQALVSKPPVQQLADWVAQYFIAAVLLLALAGGIAWSFIDPNKGFSVALTVLVASCPCALSLATPAALAAGINRLAKRGILVLKQDGLMRAAKVSHVIFDKTGTLTSEQLELLQVHCRPELEQKQALSLAAGLERVSQHPIAQAFAAYPAADFSKLKTSPQGVSGYHQNQHYKMQRCKQSELSQWGIIAQPGHLYIALLNQQHSLAVFTLATTLRPEAKASVQALQADGIEVHLYSGDHSSNVAAIAKQLNIQHYAGDLSAEDKLQKLKRLQQQYRVAAVGDGVNDAPLLAAADVGIAMGSGTAQTQSSAALVLNNNQLSNLNQALAESGVIQKRIRQNVSWAIAYNLTVFPLALSGSLLPWVAAIGMACSSLVVISNALRGTPALNLED